jgi:hypothetical protein
VAAFPGFDYTFTGRRRTRDWTVLNEYDHTNTVDLRQLALVLAGLLVGVGGSDRLPEQLFSKAMWQAW